MTGEKNLEMMFGHPNPKEIRFITFFEISKKHSEPCLVLGHILGAELHTCVRALIAGNTPCVIVAVIAANVQV